MGPKWIRVKPPVACHPRYFKCQADFQSAVPKQTQRFWSLSNQTLNTPSLPNQTRCEPFHPLNFKSRATLPKSLTIAGGSCSLRVLGPIYAEPQLSWRPSFPLGPALPCLRETMGNHIDSFCDAQHWCVHMRASWRSTKSLRSMLNLEQFTDWVTVPGYEKSP